MGMRVSVGTFNLNNLFSRYNFQAEISELPAALEDVHAEMDLVLTGVEPVRVRQYMGRLVKQKDPKESLRMVERIVRMNVDVLAVQEVEDVDTLRGFNEVYLKGMYPFVGLIEGNDPRLIDVGVLSKLPIGGMSSWQHKVHPDDPGKRVFGRDALEVEIYDVSRRRRLFTLYVNHLKSQFMDFRMDPVEGKRRNDERRRQQVESLVEIITARHRPDGRYIVLGDMNDGPESEPLAALRELGVVDGLVKLEELRNGEIDIPEDVRWTHRFKKSGEPAHYALFDQIWLSPNLEDELVGAKVDRRSRLGGDGSDHDPVWVELEV